MREAAAGLSAILDIEMKPAYEALRRLGPVAQRS